MKGGLFFDPAALAEQDEAAARHEERRRDSVSASSTLSSTPSVSSSSIPTLLGWSRGASELESSPEACRPVLHHLQHSRRCHPHRGGGAYQPRAWLLACALEPWVAKPTAERRPRPWRRGSCLIESPGARSVRRSRSHRRGPARTKRRPWTSSHGSPSRRAALFAVHDCLRFVARLTRASAFFVPASFGFERSATTAVTGSLLPRRPTASR